MKDIDIISSEENLYKAFKDSLTGRKYRKSSKKFAVDPFPQLLKLQQELKNRTYDIKGYTSFTVTEPKERLILACYFRDKIVQHSLCDNVLVPTMEKICILDNYAGQKGKGTKFGRDRLKFQMKEFLNKNNYRGYIYKGDIHKFYYSIDHEIAKKIMHKHYNQDIWWIIDRFIDSTSNPGIALGNQINTIISNLYLNELDQYVTKILGIKYYGRYADDFYIIEQDKTKLKRYVSLIEKFLQDKLKLSINPKSQIIPIRRGVKFIGFYFYEQNHKIICKLENSKRHNHKRKFNRAYRQVLSGRISLEALQVSETSWEAHASYADKIDFSYYHQCLKKAKEEE